MVQFFDGSTSLGTMTLRGKRRVALDFKPNGGFALDYRHVQWGLQLRRQHFAVRYHVRSEPGRHHYRARLQPQSLWLRAERDVYGDRLIVDGNRLGTVLRWHDLTGNKNPKRGSRIAFDFQLDGRIALDYRHVQWGLQLRRQHFVSGHAGGEPGQHHYRARPPAPILSGYGQSVTFTATVSSSTTTGSVQFFDGAPPHWGQKP